MNNQAKLTAKANGLHYGEHYAKARKVAGYLLPTERECFEKALMHQGLQTTLIPWFRNGWEQALNENGIAYNAA